MCTNELEFPAVKGRPPLFCSPRHRKQYDRDRIWLTDQLKETQLNSPGDRRRIAILKWHLHRYPSLHGESTSGTGATNVPVEVHVLTEGPASRFIDPKLWAMLADRDTAWAIAGNPLAPPPVLEFLSQHPNKEVRTKVAGNEATDPHLLEILTTDPVARVRAVAARNPLTPESARRRAHRDRAASVRSASMSRRRVMNWDTYQRTRDRARTKSASMTEVANAFHAVTLDTLIQYVHPSPSDVQHLDDGIREALAPLHHHRHRELTMRVIAEVTQRLSSQRNATLLPKASGTRISLSSKELVEKVMQPITFSYVLDNDAEQEMRNKLEAVLQQFPRET